jgi:hypothetical protein
MSERKSKSESTTRTGKPLAPAPKSKSITQAKSISKPAVKSNKASDRAIGTTASQLISQRIQELNDWRGETLALMRKLILDAASEITEEWKWMGTPVWSHHGNICTGETYKQVVKLTFAKGASLPDPHQLFNSSLEGNTRRAIDIKEGEKIDAKAFQALIQRAVAENLRTTGAQSKSKSKATAKSATMQKSAKDTKPAKQPKAKKVVLLSGGNPQIAKAVGDAPVQAYISALTGWKKDLCQKLDALIVHTISDVRKAVKWNSPFYGLSDQGWFLSYHVFKNYVKVTFFAGSSLQPIPPGGTPKSKEARWIDIYEDDKFDAAQMTSWLKQAAALPGWLS